MIIDWLDLPKLTTLTGNSINDCDTFRNPHHITLESDSPPTLIIIRHAPSHNCHSDKRTSILLQEWRHNPRKHPLHSSLTPRHRSSSALLQLITETCMISSSFCSIHNNLVHQKITELCEVVSDSNEWRRVFVLSSFFELIIGLETIHVFNTLFDRVEKNRIRFREGSETSHFTLLWWATCLHQPFYWGLLYNRFRQLFCYFVSKCAIPLQWILRMTFLPINGWEGRCVTSIGLW